MAVAPGGAGGGIAAVDRSRVIVAVGMAEAPWTAVPCGSASVVAVIVAAGGGVVDGVALSDVGLRKKGFLGSLDDNKPSLKISLDEYIEQDLLGTHDITLNNAKQDPSYLNQCLGYATFAAAGVPASRCNFAHVTVNVPM